MLKTFIFDLTLNITIEDLLLEQDPGKYFFISQGVLSIDGIDDCQEMKDTKKAFDTLMFTQVTEFQNV